MWLPIVLVAVHFTTVFSGPPPELLRGNNGLSPKCFPTRPHCIRPRVEECRETIVRVYDAGPEYPLIFGRAEVIKESPHTFTVPRLWSSVPLNCILNVDVTDPKATEEVSLSSLAAMAEVVVRRCVVSGTGCGGSALIGRGGRLKVTVAYYTAMDRMGPLLLPWHSNITRPFDEDVV
ncbi:MAG: hypothetical protein LQ339_006604 [Xanthoria mediterranea]|nr:MAG: hypothetical protein LQ339_006604 [Xanthoria mediterranea]